MKIKKKRRYRRLSPADVKMIRASWKQKIPVQLIARRLRSTPGAVYLVINRKTHVSVR